MAKRFSDTKLTRQTWYRKLPPIQKCAWRFLTDECDCAGVWDIDQEAMEFYLGESIDLEKTIDAFNCDGKIRVVRITGRKLFITGFVEFQYGQLSVDCKPHKPVIARLTELSLFDESKGYPKGYSKGFQTLQEKEKDKEKEKGKKGGLGENSKPSSDLKSALAACELAWEQTLTHFKAKRPLLDREREKLGRMIQQHGSEVVQLVLAGPRAEKPNESFDPAQHLSLDRIFHPQKVERFINLGSQLQAKQTKTRCDSTNTDQLDPMDIPADPARLRAILDKTFGAKNQTTEGVK